MPHLIYGLYDPRVSPRIVRYVGYTGKSVDRRLVEHCYEATHTQTCHRTKWIHKLLSEGVTPAAVVLEQVHGHEWQAKEREWIEKLRRQPGSKLVNSTAGGEGLTNPDEDVRQRIAATIRTSGSSKGNQARKGIPHSPEDKQKISAAVKASAKFQAAVECKKGRDPLAAFSPEQRAAWVEKIRLSKLGKKRAPLSEQARSNMRAGQLGRKHSEETKAKIRAANIGNKNGVGCRMPISAKAAIAAAKCGTRLITDGVSRKFLKPNTAMPEGWRYVK